MKKDEKAISKNQIVEWKEQFGKIYKTTIGDEDFIWRTIRRKEYVELVKSNADILKGDDKDILALQDELYYQRQEDIVLAAILKPEKEEMRELIEQQGGLATALSDEIMDKSGFVRPETNAL